MGAGGSSLDEKRVNEILTGFARKTDITPLAAKSDLLATILLCRAATFSNLDSESTRVLSCSIILAIGK